MFIKVSGTQEVCGSTNVNSLLLSIMMKGPGAPPGPNLHLKEHSAKHDVSSPGLSKECLHHLCVPNVCQGLLLASLKVNEATTNPHKNAAKLKLGFQIHHRTQAKVTQFIDIWILHKLFYQVLYCFVA